MRLFLSLGANATAKRWRDTTGTYMKVAKNVNLRSDGPDDENPNVYYSFESTPYAGGRIEANGTGLTVRKYVTDHLGSVRVIVTNNAVVERSDYYPFGSKHPNTTFPTLTSNRYGFSGKERQNISSSLDPYIDFGARFYDPLTARWLQQDPMADKYTSLTQYNYCGGDPVNYVDEEGNKIVFAENASPEFKKAFALTVKYMNSRGTAGNLAKLERSPIVYTIEEVTATDNVRFSPKTKTIYWDYQHLMKTTSHLWLSSATLLDHEAEHAIRYDISECFYNEQEKKEYKMKGRTKDDDYGNVEEREVISRREQITARKHHEIRQDQVTRTNNQGLPFKYGVVKNLSPFEIEKIIKKNNDLF